MHHLQNDRAKGDHPTVFSHCVDRHRRLHPTSVLHETRRYYFACMLNLIYCKNKALLCLTITPAQPFPKRNGRHLNTWTGKVAVIPTSHLSHLRMVRWSAEASGIMANPTKMVYGQKMPSSVPSSSPGQKMLEPTSDGYASSNSIPIPRPKQSTICTSTTITASIPMAQDGLCAHGWNSPTTPTHVCCCAKTGMCPRARPASHCRKTASSSSTHNACGMPHGIQDTSHATPSSSPLRAVRPFSAGSGASCPLRPPRVYTDVGGDS